MTVSPKTSLSRSTTGPKWNPTRTPSRTPTAGPSLSTRNCISVAAAAVDFGGAR
ncbi:MAG: hypothetical protein ACKVP9_14655 [Burkholderiales bacterium]